jgi:DNA ligase D-like protein (predicted 3'-phosphoesterase)
LDRSELKRYNAKRDFRRTGEPEGLPGGEMGQTLYVVQKHDASTLHYDFRISLGGVLKSWAIPKGPSLNPRDKRLAIRTEDHPLAYASFEGVIPQGEAGVGADRIDDRGDRTLPPSDVKFIHAPR